MKETIIKRYPNRKLYDTDLHCYVTLKELGQYLRENKPFRVFDNRSRQDITYLIELSIVYGLEREVYLKSGKDKSKEISDMISSGKYDEVLY